MTNSFLLTQQKVMLLYLNTRSASVKTVTCLDLQPTLMPVVVPTPTMRPMSTPLNTQASPTPSFQLLEDETQEQPAKAESIPVSNIATTDGIVRHVENAPEQVILQDSESLVCAFTELVSQRTGYPVDMLDPDLDLESDLGIDSIKRVEILSNFRRLLSEDMQDQFEGSLDNLAGLRTIQGISDWIRQIPQRN